MSFNLVYFQSRVPEYPCRGKTERLWYLGHLSQHIGYQVGFWEGNPGAFDLHKDSLSDMTDDDEPTKGQYEAEGASDNSNKGQRGSDGDTEESGGEEGGCDTGLCVGVKACEEPNNCVSEPDSTGDDSLGQSPECSIKEA